MKKAMNVWVLIAVLEVVVSMFAEMLLLINGIPKGEDVISSDGVRRVSG